MTDKLIHHAERLWMPVRTKPRQEKKLAEYCKVHNIDYYLPLRRKLHRYSKGKCEFTLPMFSGYIFCCLNQELYSVLVRSNAVLFKINLDEIDEARLLGELRNIYQLEMLALEHTLVIKPELKPGIPVTISSGPFRGIEGIVSFRNNRHYITINIEMLGQSVSAKVDIDAVEKA